MVWKNISKLFSLGALFALALAGMAFAYAGNGGGSHQSRTSFEPGQIIVDKAIGAPSAISLEPGDIIVDKIAEPGDIIVDKYTGV